MKRQLPFEPLLAFLLLGGPAVAMERALGSGQMFPDIHLPDLASGKLQSISSFRGKKLLLHIFASW